MKHTFHTLLMSAVLCGGASRAALAQTAAPATQAPASVLALAPGSQRKSTRPIRVQNVPPSLIAFWLDPKNHPLPTRFGTKRNSLDLAANPTSESPFALPAGIDQIIAVDPQEVLLVIGTEAGIQNLAATVAFLDRPLRQVEIEAQWVQVSPEEARAFGINYSASQGNFNAAANGFPPPVAAGVFQVGFVRGNYTATLAQLVKQKRAKILTAPRITAINNFESIINNFSASPAKISFQDDANRLAARFEGATQIGIEYVLAVTPTINNDNTVTVLMSTSSKLKITTAAGDELISPQTREALETIVNVRDGDTFALSGLSTLQAQLAPGTARASSNLLIFLTARIVRRAEDDARPVALTH